MLSYLTLSNLWALLRSLLDILCLWAIVYYCLKIVKNNSYNSNFQRYTSLLSLSKELLLYLDFIQWKVLWLLLCLGGNCPDCYFQPEIRSMLEKIGKTNVFSHI